jgi:hypothetical protein
MPSITTWFRLEPQVQGDDVAAGVAARIHDPLWLLTRQWQVGEFQSEDGGTPIVARWRAQHGPLVRYHLGPLAPAAHLTAPRLDAERLPLEALVERLPIPQEAADLPGLDGLRLAVETGQHFLRILRRQATTADYGDAFRRTYAVRPAQPGTASDPATASYLQLVSGRALDGRRLRAALAAGPLPGLIETTIDSGDVAEVRAACAEWLTWADALFSQPDDTEQAWQPDRMEYAFSVAGRLGPDRSDERTLTAEQYTDGVLDWHSFDRNGEASLGTAADDAGEILTRTVIPAPVTARGLPAARFWEFEDALLDLGALQPSAADLPQLLMIETITGYGNDWFVVPIELPAGSLVAARSLVVTDTFGLRTLIRPSGDASLADTTPWSMYQLAMPVDSTTVPVSNLFFLAPTILQPLDGPVLEEVVLLRDEQANLAWAVERRLESPLEVGVDTAGDAIDNEPPQPASPLDVPIYRLAAVVPAHWIPLLPTRNGETGQVQLVRAAVLQLQDEPRIVRSQARLLGRDPSTPLRIPEEEVSHSGTLLRRAFQAARWYDGRLFVWLANRKTVGCSEGSSGLRFDSLEQ